MKQNFIISPLIENDAKQLHLFIADNKERLKLFFPVTLEMNSSLEKTEAYISTRNKEIKEKINFTFAIRDKNNQQISGLIIIKKINWEIKQGELAYCIDSEIEGQGVTSFAVKQMIKFGFDELDLKTLQIIAHKTNIGSCLVAEKNNFVWQRTLPNEFTPTDKNPLDMELYELYK